MTVFLYVQVATGLGYSTLYLAVIGLDIS